MARPSPVIDYYASEVDMAEHYGTEEDHARTAERRHRTYDRLGNGICRNCGKHWGFHRSSDNGCPPHTEGG